MIRHWEHLATYGKTLARVAFRIAVVATVIVLADFFGLAFYGLLTKREMLSNLSFLLLAEGGVMMFFGVLGTTVLPQRGTIGVPWCQSVHAVSEEIRRDRSRQVDFWICFGIVGFVLFLAGIILPTAP